MGSSPSMRPNRYWRSESSLELTSRCALGLGPPSRSSRRMVLRSRAVKRAISLIDLP
jgi:hypothetical protein